MYDLIIIGGGPAGIAAGVYASRKRLRTLLLTYAIKSQLNFGGQSVVSEGIQNWIGEVEISGTELAKKLEAHLRAYAEGIVDIKTDEKVTDVTESKDGFKISSENGTVFYDLICNTVLV